MSPSSGQGEVYIKTADLGVQRGYLYASPGSLKLDSSIVDIQLIKLEIILRKPYYSP